MSPLIVGQVRTVVVEAVGLWESRQRELPGGDARRKADRERRTGQGHRLTPHSPPRMPRDSRAMPGNSGQAGSDRAARDTGSKQYFLPNNGEQ